MAVGKEPYTAQISRDNPTCFVFLVDQSGSMDATFGGQPNKKKKDGVADAINKLLRVLCIKSMRQDGIREFFQIAVIGYGGTKAQSVLGGKLADRGLVPIKDISEEPLRVETRKKKTEDGAGGFIEQAIRFPVWLEPAAAGKTPMKQALDIAHDLLSEFLAKFPDCFPPIVINLTDGKADPPDPADAAQAVRDLSSSDGNVLLLNAHITDRTDPPIMYPESEHGLPDDFAKQLFRMSSMLPKKMIEAARASESELSDMGVAARGFVFNADLIAIIGFLDIGTRFAVGAAQP